MRRGRIKGIHGTVVAIDEVKPPKQEDFSPGWYQRVFGISGAYPDDPPKQKSLPPIPVPKPPLGSRSPSQWEKWKKEYDALPAMKPLPGPEDMKVALKPLPNLNLNNSLWNYLTKWLETASGGRVVLDYSTGRFIRFKCEYCKDNWNVGEELFTANGQEAIPYELTEWVDKHHHVCKNFQDTGGHTLNRCERCKWPYHKHEEAKPKYVESTGEWIAPAPPSGMSKLFTAKVVEIDSGVKIAKSPTGRKFRE